MTSLNLRQQLLLTTLLPAALIALLTIGFFTWRGLQTLSDEQGERGLSTVRLIAPISELNLLTGQIEALQSLVDGTVREHGVKAAMVLNHKARPLAVAGHISLGAEQFRPAGLDAAVLAEGRDWIAFGAPVTRTRLPADPLFDERSTTSRQDSEPVGYVVVEFDRGPILRKQQALLQQAVVLVLLSLLLIGLLASRVADRFGAPLVRLAAALAALRQGRLEHRMPDGEKGPLSGLTKTFNAAAADLDQRLTNLVSDLDTVRSQALHYRDRDPATGTLNQSGFSIRLAERLAREEIGHYPYALAWIRLTHVHAISNTLGLAATDQMLLEIADTLQAQLQRHDLMGHVAPGEFVVLLQNTPEALARQRAEDWLGWMTDFRFIHHGDIYSTGAAIGLLCLRDPNTNAVSALTRGREIAVTAEKQDGEKLIVEELHTLRRGPAYP